MAYKDKEKQREYDKKKYQKNREKILKQTHERYLANKEKKSKYNHEYYQANKEQENERGKKYKQANKEKISNYNHEYQQANKEEIKKKRHEYYLKDREKEIGRAKNWQDKYPEKAREINRRHNGKRRHNLGFHPLNNWFAGSEAHHINEEQVIYIPKSLHQSISHCLKTGRNMILINSLAYQYLMGKYIIYKQGDDNNARL